ncbi:MAG: hypothetical protein CMP68_02805 [Flavobacteriales bacterium]|nr:hypothetical protein [Flavobacteriales bacterium]|tara:strand:- start:8380 stop:8922 length:543 start_codon:yes stop_codon:yes gene_type:complete
MFRLLSFISSYGSVVILVTFFVSVIFLFIYRLKFKKKNEKEKKYFSKKTNVNEANINLKMQAFERLTILLERTDPYRLLSLIDKSETDLNKIELTLLNSLVSEFEYNLSQQVYVSDNLWNLIIISKNKSVAIISSVKSSLSSKSNGVDFFNAMRLVLDNQETTPSKIALSYLKKEARSIL